MRYYDLFSYVYDSAIERSYRPYRRQIAEALELKDDSQVLDVACGTGQNFEELVAHLGPEGRVAGIDASAGMLNVARRRVRKRGFHQVKVLQVDVFDLDADELAPLLGGSRPDRVVCTLGMTVIPDWEAALDRIMRLLQPGGRIVIFDIHADKLVPQSYLAGLFARADVTRKTWAPLQRDTDNFQLRILPGSPHVHGGRPFIATGDKPRAAD